MYKKITKYWFVFAIVFEIIFSAGYVSALSTYQIVQGGTGTSTAPGFNKIYIGGPHNELEYVSTSSLNISGGGGSSVFTLDGYNNIFSSNSNYAGTPSGPDGSNFFVGTSTGGDPSNSGINDISIGALAGTSNTTGSINTAIGQSALTTNTSGTENTAIGGQAMYNNSMGNTNTALGYNALFTSSSGSENVGLGNTAGFNLSSGSDNIAIGSGTDFPDPNGNSQLNIGNLIFGVVADTGTSTGDVGIGINDPSYTLDVNGSFHAENGGVLEALGTNILDFSNNGNPSSSQYYFSGAILHGNGSGLTNIVSTYLVDGSGNIVVNGSDRDTIDTSNIVSLNWQSRYMNDNSGNISIDWQNKYLYALSGASIDLDFSSTSGIQLPNGILTIKGAAPVGDGTYTVGLGLSQNGTITTVGGIITSIQQAS